MYNIIFLIVFLFFLVKKNNFEKWRDLQNDNYFNYFNVNDFKFRNCNSIEKCKYLYSKSEIPLTPFEKRKIKEFCENFIKKINHKYLFVFNNLSIIKVNLSIENSLPHTRGRHIILSKRWIDRFLENQNNLVLNKLLSHEQFHVYQRFNQDKIDNFYKNYWNMEKLKTKIPIEILNLNRTNPDALPDINWLFKRDNDLILPMCLYKENASSMLDTENIYFRLDKNHNFIDIVDDLDNRKLLINESKYTDFFGSEISNNYHANEMSASLFELIIEDIITDSNVNRPPAYHKMKEFLDSEN